MREEQIYICENFYLFEKIVGKNIFNYLRWKYLKLFSQIRIDKKIIFKDDKCLSYIFNSENCKLSKNIIEYIFKEKILKNEILKDYFFYELLKEVDNKENKNIVILLNHINDYINKKIKQLNNEYKTVNIVTKKINIFNNLEKKIFEEYNNYLIITNNTRISKCGDIIINIDCNPLEIEKIGLKKECNLYNFNINKINKIECFYGNIINIYDYINKEFIDKFYNILLHKKI